MTRMMDYVEQGYIIKMQNMDMSLKLKRSKHTKNVWQLQDEHIVLVFIVVTVSIKYNQECFLKAENSMLFCSVCYWDL